MHRSLAAVLIATLAPVVAQVAPGHAAVGWRDAAGTTRGIDIVAPDGTAVRLTGLDPLTIGTQVHDGLRCLLAADDGLLFAGLAVDNTSGTAPVPLSLRLIVRSGAVAADVHFASLMPVPPGEAWFVADLAECDDGALLVAVTKVFGPPPNNAVFRVGRGADVHAVPIAAMGAGNLVAIADLGDRFAVALDRPFGFHDIALEALHFDGSDTAWQIAQLPALRTFSGLERDLNGELVYGAVHGSAVNQSMGRVWPIPGATPRVIPGPLAQLFDFNPGSGMATSLQTRLGFTELQVTSSVAGGTHTVRFLAPIEPIALSKRDNPSAYGLSSPPGTLPLLAARGEPRMPHLGFSLLLGEPRGIPATAFVFAGIARGSVPLPFGTLLVDPSAGIVGIGAVPLPLAAPATLPLPLPASPGLRGLHFPFQALVVTATSAALSNGLDLMLP